MNGDDRRYTRNKGVPREAQDKYNGAITHNNKTNSWECSICGRTEGTFNEKSLIAHYNEHIAKKLCENSKYDKIRHNDDDILELALIRGRTLKEIANTIQDEINKMIQEQNNTRNYADVRLENDEEWELEKEEWKIYKINSNGTRRKTTHLLKQMIPIFEEIKPEQVPNNILTRIKKHTKHHTRV